MSIVENIRKYGNELEEVKNEIASLSETIKNLDEIPSHITCEINFTGMYKRSSKRISMTINEAIEILITRREHKKKHRDNLIEKLNSFL